MSAWRDPEVPDAAARALDAAAEEDAQAALAACCGAARWVAGMLARRPFGDGATLLRAANEVWATMGDDDIREAFTHHPRIGGDLEALRQKFAHVQAQSKDWSEGEQAGVSGASEEVLEALRDGNVAYEARFGHLFIVCASGKTAAEMLALLQARQGNDPADELRIAAEEQRKITALRLAKLRVG